MEETPLEATGQFTGPTPRKKINRRFLYLLAFILLIILLFIGYKILNIGKVSQKAVPTPTPAVFQIPTDTPTPEVSPTSTITPSPTAAVSAVDKATGLDRSKLSVIVENGSGEAGVAKKGADFLTSLGYTVSSTGNANNYNYTNVTIQVKAADSKYLNLLKSDLGKNYTVGSATADLSSGSSSDAIVIIGK